MVKTFDWENGIHISLEEFLNDDSDDYLHKRSYVLLKIDAKHMRSIDDIVAVEMVMACSADLNELKEFIRSKYPAIDSNLIQSKTALMEWTSFQEDPMFTQGYFDPHFRNWSFYLIEPYIFVKMKETKSMGLMTVNWLKYNLNQNVYDISNNNNGTKFLIFNYMTEKFEYINANECKII